MRKGSLKNYILDNQEVYNGKYHKITHLPNTNKDSDYLLVVLSGFNGGEVAGREPLYNYVRTLEDISVNQLFILDGVDNVPVYYYGSNKTESYLKDTSDLIQRYIDELNIEKSNVIIAGSSKGGTGALLVGLYMELGHIISGANQLDVGTYLDTLPKVREIMFNKIFGNNLDSNVRELDNSFRRHFLINDTISKLYFHAGNRDSHYIKHMKPMLKHYDEKNINYELDLRNYSDHSSLQYYFPEYFLRKLNEIFEMPKIMDVKILKNFDENIIKLKVNRNKISLLNSIELMDRASNIVAVGFDKSLVREIDAKINDFDFIRIDLKEYDEIVFSKKFSIKPDMYDFDYFSKNMLVEGEWLTFKGEIAKNKKMYRTYSIPYSGHYKYSLSAGAYVSYFKDNTFLKTIRLKGPSSMLPYELENVSGANNIYISFDEKWLDKIHLDKVIREN